MTAPVPGTLPLSLRLRSNLLRAPWFFLATGFFGFLSLVASCFETDGKLQHRIAQQWARVSVRIAGARMEVIGRENLRSWAIYASNHASYMDTPVIFANLPFQFRILAKQSLWKWPFIGWHLNRSGQIPVPVDDAGAGSTISGLSRALRALRGGMPLFIFPEGGRTETGELQPFMNGPAFLAIRAQAPLIPMALVGTYELLPTHASHFRPGPVRLVIGAPIDPSGCNVRQTDQLTARLREEISSLAKTYALPEPAAPNALPEARAGKIGNANL
jgi:1-acyl-sn-glycerol-3-phosphate acyltransferase